MSKVQEELTSTTNRCTALSRENELLKGSRLQHPSVPVHPPCSDPLAEQVQKSVAQRNYDMSVLAAQFPKGLCGDNC